MNLRKQLSSYIALNNYVEAFRENTSSIVLTDAITNGLTDLQLKGGTEQNGTPTPDTPIDITSNNGVLKVSPNLFNKNASYALYNGYINNKSVGENTTLMDYSGGEKTIIIKVAPNTTYTVTRVTNLGSVYDRIRCAAFTTLPSSGSTGVILCNYMNTTQANATFTTLSDTQYVAINVRNSGAVGDDWIQFVDAFQLEQGSTATQYRPYGQIYTDGTPETITITGKNLLDINKTSGAGYLNTSGELVLFDNYYCSDYIEIKPSTVYTYTETMKSVDHDNFIRFCFYDSNKTFIPPRQGNTPTAEAKTYTYKITSPVNAKYIRISSNSNFVKGQLEEDIRPTKYEEYYQVSFAPEDLLKLSDYQDVQSVLDGVVTRNVGIKVLDGTEDWKTAYSGFYSTALSNHIASAPTCCNYFQGVTTGTIPPTGERENKVWLGSSWLGLGATTRFPTVAEFKQWLADQYATGTPVIVVYPLADTVKETVESRDVFITSGTNTIERNSEYVSSNGITVKYKKLR